MIKVNLKVGKCHFSFREHLSFGKYICNLEQRKLVISE